MSRRMDLLSSLPDDLTRRSGLTWDDYRAEVTALGEQGSPRLYFADGVLLTQGPPDEAHEVAIGLVERLADHFAEKHGLVLAGLRGTTLESETDRVAATPHASFQVGSRRRGERPDIVVEVDHDRAVFAEKRSIYRRLGIREVWGLAVASLPALQRGDVTDLHPLLAYGSRGAEGRTDSFQLPGLDLDRMAMAVAYGLNASAPAREAKQVFDNGAPTPRPSAPGWEPQIDI